MKHDADDYFRDTTMTFGEHLEELRICLFRAVIGLVLGCLVGLFVGKYVVHLVEVPMKRALTRYYQQLSLDQAEARVAALGPDAAEADIRGLVEDDALLPEILLIDPREVAAALRKKYPKWSVGDIPAGEKAPLRREDLIEMRVFHAAADDARLQLSGLAAEEPFMIYLKAALVTGAVISSPWVFLQLWTFVAAGLYPHEKHYVHVFLPFSVGLFLAGASFAFLFVFDPVLNFLLQFNRALDIAPEPRINEWMGFVLILPLGFGISFQLPLAMLFLERIGMFNVTSYMANWRVSVLVIFVLSAILTPADPYSLLFMAGPLTTLYFGGVLLCKYLPRSRSPIAPLD